MYKRAQAALAAISARLLWLGALHHRMARSSPRSARAILQGSLTSTSWLSSSFQKYTRLSKRKRYWPSRPKRAHMHYQILYILRQLVRAIFFHFTSTTESFFSFFFYFYERLKKIFHSQIFFFCFYNKRVKLWKQCFFFLHEKEVCKTIKQSIAKKKKWPGPGAQSITYTKGFSQATVLLLCVQYNKSIEEKRTSSQYAPKFFSRFFYDELSSSQL